MMSRACLITVLFAAACGTAAPGLDVSDQSQQAEMTDLVGVECSPGLVRWAQGLCAPRVDECQNPWEMPVLGGGCVAVGQRGCPRLWEPLRQDSGQADADVDCVAGELLPCPEGLTESEDGAWCYPRFDECGETEVPTLGGGCKAIGPDFGPEGEPYFDYCDSGLLALPGGGCVPVGPRACPLVWDEQADVDCQPLELAACPEGWDPADGGMYCVPTLDECQSGERPQFGGGCQRVIPGPDDCPQGPFPEPPDNAQAVLYVDAKSGCVEGCGSEVHPFATISSAIAQAVPGSSVLVAAGNYDEGLLIDKPLRVAGICPAKTIIVGSVEVGSAGGKATTAGIAVVGTTDVVIQDLTVISPGIGIAVLESSAALVERLELAGSTGMGLYGHGGSKTTAMRIWVHSTIPGEEAFASGLGLWFEDGADLDLSESLVEGNHGAGVYARGQGTIAKLKHSTIRDTQPGGSGLGGWGLRIKNQAHAQLDRVVITGNHSAGIQASFNGEALGQEVAVTGTTPDGNGAFGFGIDASSAASVSLAQSWLADNGVAGVMSTEPDTQVSLRGCVVRDSQTGDKGAWGVFAGDGGKVVVEGSLLAGHAEAAIRAEGAGTMLELAGVALADTQVLHCEYAGGGALVGDGATLTAGFSLFEGNLLVGAAVIGKGSTATLASTTFRDTLDCLTPSGEEVWGGWGVAGVNGALVEVKDSLVERSGSLGVGSQQPGTLVNINRCVIRDPLSLAGSVQAAAAQAFDAGKLTFTASVASGHKGLAVSASGPDSQATVSNSAILDTDFDEGETGYGLAATNGGLVTASQCLLEDNSYMSAVAFDPGSRLELADTLIQSTRVGHWVEIGENGEEKVHFQGVAVAVADGAEFIMDSCRLSRSSAISIGIVGEGSFGHVRKSLVTDTEPSVVTGQGIGASVYEGALLLEDSVIRDSVGIAVSVYGEQTTAGADIIRSVIRQTNSCFGYATGPCAEAYGNLLSGIGVMGVLDADVWLEDSLLEENSGVGTLGTHGARIGLARSVIRLSTASLLAAHGIGIAILDGSTALVQGSLIELNTQYGIQAVRPETEAVVRGTILRNGFTSEESVVGEALVAALGAAADVSWTLVSGNATAGLAVVRAGSRLHVSHSAVLDTRSTTTQLELEGGETEWQSFADGIAVVDAELHLESSIIAGNGRAGVYCQRGTGEMIDSVVTGNSSYGLALEESASTFGYGDRGNYVLGNALELPPAQAAEVTTNPTGLPPPPLVGLTR